MKVEINGYLMETNVNNIFRDDFGLVELAIQSISHHTQAIKPMNKVMHLLLGTSISCSLQSASTVSSTINAPENLSRFRLGYC